MARVPNRNSKELGAYVDSLLKAKSMTQTDLAKKIGTDQSYVSQLKRGEIGMPGPDILHPMADALGTTEMELLKRGGYIRPGKDEMPSIPPQLEAIYDDIQKLPPERAALRLEMLGQIAKTLQSMDTPATNNHSPEAEAQP